jgi:hypothetical protein
LIRIFPNGETHLYALPICVSGFRFGDVGWLGVERYVELNT